MITVSSQFDSGNIEVDDIRDPAALRLRIRSDNASSFYQWFHFRVSGAAGQELGIHLTNAATAAYPPAWPGTRPCYSYDRVTWRRLDGTYANGTFSWRHKPERDAVWYAYFAPYSWERHMELIGRCAADPRVSLVRLGSTLDGRDLDELVVGTGERKIWVIARQHPGESMGEWWMEGFLGRLLDPADALARVLLERATLHVVPNMNPDGSVRGNLRTNAAGANLNREWLEPTMERSPEVKLVRDEMDRVGCDLCLDVHGDEEIPNNFIAGAHGIPAWSDRHARLLDAFQAAFVRANPDFQTAQGYQVDAPGQANMTMCTNQIAQRFDCLSMTLEMPFKDTTARPDPEEGWSPRRAMRLGASALDPMMAVLDRLR